MQFKGIHKTPEFYLAVFILFLLALNTVWINYNTALIASEELAHYKETLLLEEMLSRADTPGAFIKAALTTNHYYPPLLYWMTLAAYKISGDNPAAFDYVQFPFWIVFVIGVYMFSSQLVKKKTALVITVMASLNSLVLFTGRHFYIDFPQHALVPVTLAAFLLSNRFSKTGWSLACGVFFGLGCLAKWTFPVFVVPVLAFFIFKDKSEDFKWKKILPNLGYIILIVLVICGPWYIANWPRLYDDIFVSGLEGANRENDPPVFTFSSLLYYPWILKTYAFYPVFILGIAGIVYVLWGKERRTRQVAALAVFIGSLVIMTLLKNKDIRYFLPAFFLFYHLAFCWMDDGKWKGYKYVRGALIIFSLLRVTLFWMPFTLENNVVDSISRPYEVQGNSAMSHTELVKKGRLQWADFLPLKGFYLIGMPPDRSGFKQKVKDMLEYMKKEGLGGDVKELETVYMFTPKDRNDYGQYLSKAIPIYAGLMKIPMNYHVVKKEDYAVEPDFIIRFSPDGVELPVKDALKVKTYEIKGYGKVFLYRPADDL